MNREIKFRGKRVDNGEWVYGDLIQLHDERKYIINNKFGACLDEKGNFINTESPFVNKVIPKTLGQYTGLKDKNGVEIYEGDILRDFSEEIEDWVVSYKHGEFVGVFDNIMCDLFELTDLEVAGNIYENEVKYE